ncbi:hypothetical protein BKA62DRAFT_107941 [Auriculariales sp. MPI-PUGE-AT-0066]|nr:hypothetical protein BKA62DRAFT_107941 [Auriculariales sp. MPI-PUGE-AT-0066]
MTASTSNATFTRATTPLALPGAEMDEVRETFLDAFSQIPAAVRPLLRYLDAYPLPAPADPQDLLTYLLDSASAKSLHLGYTNAPSSFSLKGPHQLHGPCSDLREAQIEGRESPLVLFVLRAAPNLERLSLVAHRGQADDNIPLDLSLPNLRYLEFCYGARYHSGFKKMLFSSNLLNLRRVSMDLNSAYQICEPSGCDNRITHIRLYCGDHGAAGHMSAGDNIDCLVCAEVVSFVRTCTHLQHLELTGTAEPSLFDRFAAVLSAPLRSLSCPGFWLHGRVLQLLEQNHPALRSLRALAIDGFFTQHTGALRTCCARRRIQFSVKVENFWDNLDSRNRSTARPPSTFEY